MKKEKPTRSKAIKDSESVAHYESVLLEEMRGNFKAVIESVGVLGGKVDLLDNKIDGVDNKIGRETASIRADMGVMHQQLNQKIDSVASKLEQKIDSVKSELKSDINDLSKKVDRIETHVISHDEDIRLLKQAG